MIYIIGTKSYKWRMFGLVSIISLELSLSLTLTLRKWDFVAELYFIYSPFLFMHALVVYYRFH